MITDSSILDSCLNERHHVAHLHLSGYASNLPSHSPSSSGTSLVFLNPKSPPCLTMKWHGMYLYSPRKHQVSQPAHKHHTTTSPSSNHYPHPTSKPLPTPPNQSTSSPNHPPNLNPTPHRRAKRPHRHPLHIPDASRGIDISAHELPDLLLALRRDQHDAPGHGQRRCASLLLGIRVGGEGGAAEEEPAGGEGGADPREVVRPHGEAGR